jgi:hypothetical protein
MARALQMARDNLKATVYCFGGWNVDTSPPASAQGPTLWQDATARASHVAATLFWAQHSASSHFSRATTHKLLVHCLSAARECGLAETHRLVLPARAMLTKLMLDCGQLRSSLRVGRKLLEAYLQVYPSTWPDTGLHLNLLSVLCQMLGESKGFWTYGCDALQALHVTHTGTDLFVCLQKGLRAMYTNAHKPLSR